MKIKYPLKATYQKIQDTRTHGCKGWSVSIQYAPKSILQAQYNLMSNHSHCFFAKTKEECKEWVRKFKSEKRYIEYRKEWRKKERYFSKKENQEKAIKTQNKLNTAFAQMGF